MFNIDKNTILTLAKDNKYNSYYLEKTLRVSAIIDYLSYANPFYHSLVLKGGPAVHLTILELKRLFMGLEFDFDSDISDTDLVIKRDEIKESLLNYMTSEGYYSTSSCQSEEYIDTFEFTYQNVSGVTDYISIKIDYKIRLHVFPPEERQIPNSITNNGLIYTLKKEELIGQLLANVVIKQELREVYDIIKVFNSGIISQEEFEDVQKCFLFYYILNGNEIEINEKVISFKEKILEMNNIVLNDSLSYILRNDETCSISVFNEKISNLLNVLLDFNIHENLFIENFTLGKYIPSLIFSQESINQRLSKYPVKFELKEII